MDDFGGFIKTMNSIISPKLLQADTRYQLNVQKVDKKAPTTLITLVKNKRSSALQSRKERDIERSGIEIRLLDN